MLLWKNCAKPVRVPATLSRRNFSRIQISLAVFDSISDNPLSLGRSLRVLIFCSRKKASGRFVAEPQVAIS